MITALRQFQLAGVLTTLALLASPAPGQDMGEGSDSLDHLKLFGTILDQIRKDYVDAPDERELMRSAVQGMLTSLDPHSNYLPPTAYDDIREGLSGEYAGVGLKTQMRDGALTVIEAFDDAPAARAGMRAGDVILAVDGVQASGMSHDEAVERLRGPVGSPVTVTVRRTALGDPISFRLERAIIATPIVESWVEDDVAILHLATFSAQAASGISRAIERIYAQRGGVAPKGIILDLRNNLGGLVDQAVLVADIFLPRGAVVLTRARNPADSFRYDAYPDVMDSRLRDVPLVVLINGASASASEIVAGALQDHRRATLIGTRSFGKGSVQSVIPLDANGAMRLTTARYYTPSNRSIQALGIVPDIEIEQVVPAEMAGADIVPGEASLAGHITIAGQEEFQTGSSAYVPATRADDTQLQYAVRLIKGQEINGHYPPDLRDVG